MTNGSEFKLHFEALCKSYGIKCKPTSGKNPQANAILERVHQVITTNTSICSTLCYSNWFQRYCDLSLSSWHITFHGSIQFAHWGSDITPESMSIIGTTSNGLNKKDQGMVQHFQYFLLSWSFTSFKNPKTQCVGHTLCNLSTFGVAFKPIIMVDYLPLLHNTYALLKSWSFMTLDTCFTSQWFFSTSHTDSPFVEASDIGQETAYTCKL